MEEVQILKLILDKSLIGYWDWNLKDDKSIISQSFQQLLGYTHEELNCFGVIDFLQKTILPEDYEKSITAIRNHFDSKGEIPYNVEERFILKDGTIVWVNSRGQVIEWDDDSKPVRMAGIHIDITKQKEQEAIIVKNNELLNSIINNTPQSVFWKDKNGVYLGCNNAFADSIGIKDSKEIIGKTDYELFENKKDIESYIKDDQEVFCTKLPKLNIKEELSDPEGKRLKLNTSKVPISDINGIPYAVLGIFDDITEQENLKKELIQTNKLYNTLSQINKLINKVTSKQKLFDDVCNLITEVGEFKIAMIGEPEGILLKPKAFSGIDVEYAKQVRVTIDDSPEGNGPAGKAYKEGRSFVVNDFLSNNTTAPWKKESLVLDLKSIATFPLKSYGKVVGALGVYSNQKNYFQSKEVNLLEEIALAIGTGLEKLEKETKQKEWEDAIIKAKEDWELTFDSIPDQIAILDTDYNILKTNKAFRENINITENKCTSQKCYAIMHGTSCTIEDCPYTKLLKDKKTHNVTRFEELLNGYYNITTSPMYNKDGSLRGSVHITKNITEQKLAENKIRQFAEMIEHSNAFIGIANMKGELTYMNKSNKRIFELEDDLELSTFKITDFLTEKGLNTFYNYTIPETSNNGIWSGELEWKNKSGKIIPVILVTMLHNDANGNPEFTSATAIDISELKKNELSLAKSATELRSLTNHLQTVREEERRNIAKEIHDELGQNLTGIKMDVFWLSNHLDTDRTVLLERFEQLKRFTDETVLTSRKLYTSLYPQMLEEIGLLATIRWHSNTYLKPNDVTVEIISNVKDEKPLPRYHLICLALYRIYQESTTNILRYSKAKEVFIKLNFNEDNVTLSIEDNGIGFDNINVDTKVHHGLVGMRERVIALNGTLSIVSDTGKGTCVNVSIPVSENLMDEKQ